jgi:hypothetical protein
MDYKEKSMCLYRKRAYYEVISMSFRTHSATLRAGFDAESKNAANMDSRLRENDKSGVSDIRYQSYSHSIMKLSNYARP